VSNELESKEHPEWLHAFNKLKEHGGLELGAKTLWTTLEEWFDKRRLTDTGADDPKFSFMWLSLRAKILEEGRYVSQDAMGFSIATAEEVPVIARKRARRAIRHRLQDAIVCGSTDTEDVELRKKLDIEQARAANQAAYLIDTTRRNLPPVEMGEIGNG
jgi:hypothetical protein